MVPQMDETLLKEEKVWLHAKFLNIRVYFREAKELFELDADTSAAMVAFRNLENLFVQVADQGFMEYEKLNFDNFTDDDVQYLGGYVKYFTTLFPYPSVLPDEHFDSFAKEYINEQLEDLEIDLDDLPDLLVIDWDATVDKIKASYAMLDIAGENYWLQHK